MIRTPCSRLISLFFLPALLMSACSYYHEKNPTTDVSSITASTVSWKQLSSEFFQTRCDVCHGQGGAGINTSDYQSVVQQIARIKSEVLTRKKMPPDSPLTTYEETLLTVWIDSGTPEVATGSNPWKFFSGFCFFAKPSFPLTLLVFLKWFDMITSIALLAMWVRMAAAF